MLATKAFSFAALPKYIEKPVHSLDPIDNVRESAADFPTIPYKVQYTAYFPTTINIVSVIVRRLLNHFIPAAAASLTASCQVVASMGECFRDGEL
jgi:hypothetical protein